MTHWLEQTGRRCNSYHSTGPARPCASEWLAPLFGGVIGVGGIGVDQAPPRVVFSTAGAEVHGAILSFLGRGINPDPIAQFLDDHLPQRHLECSRLSGVRFE